MKQQLGRALVFAALTLGCDGYAPPSHEAHADARRPLPLPEGGEWVKPTVAVDGGDLFATSCSACHGQAGVGKVGIGPRLASKTFLEAASDDMIKSTIRKGRTGTTMTAWKHNLSDAQIDGIVTYLRGLVPHEQVELDESPAKGDAKAGADVYRSICSACHGRSGAGYLESSSGTGIGRKAFLDEVTNGYLRHLIKNGKSLTKMRAFAEGKPAAVANLTDTQIEDVIAYLRGSAW
jgi:cytochrome c oxidase cbb3-type subunit 3